MTGSEHDALLPLLGSQEPRVRWRPQSGTDHPDAEAAVELAAACGMALDPWQQMILRSSLRRTPDNSKWAAFEVAAVLPRQNGKNELLIARELAGVYLFGERLIIHSAHLADTADEAFRRLVEVIEGTDWLSREVKHIWRANGKSAVELKNGARIRFRTRTRGGGRGFSGDCVVFDEAMEFPLETQQAILPVVSAMPDPQLWYAGSAVDQTVHQHGQVLASLRARALKGDDESLDYSEWSLPFDAPDDIPSVVLNDPASWAETNPAFGRRISASYVSNERRAFMGNPRAFAVERLGVGDWPALDGESSVIPLDAWTACGEDPGTIVGETVFAIDVSPDRAWGAITVTGPRADGLPQVELVEHRRGTSWMVPWLAQRAPARVLLSARSGAGSLIPALEAAGLEVFPVTADEYRKACGHMFDSVVQHAVRHLDDSVLTAALAGGRKRASGDSWVWTRVADGPDITPLVAATLSLWGTQATPAAEPFLISW